MRAYIVKCLLLLFLSISANTQAQFKITTEKSNSGWKCKMDNSEWFDSSNKIFWVVNYYNEDGEFYDVDIYILGKEQCGFVCRQCTEIDENGDRIVKGKPIIIELSNGERLRFKDDVTNEDSEEYSNVHAFSTSLLLACATSNIVNLEEAEIKDSEYYVIRQLCNYDIIGINVLGQHFSITNIRTAPTFASMFSDLSRKINNISSNKSSSTGVSAEFKQTWLELNVFQDGVKGLRVHADFSVNNAKGKTLKMNCFFFDGDGDPLISLDDKYSSADGQVMAETYVVPKYDNTSFHDVTVFIPYSELHLILGYHEIECRTTIFYNGYQYAEDDGLGFTIE